MAELCVFAGLLAAGYVLSIYTWPAARARLVGAESEIACLRTRALALEARLKGAFVRTGD